MATVLTEIRHAGSCIVSEQEGHYCRDTITIAISQVVLPNQVIGFIKSSEAGAPTVGAAAFTGTGNGTFTPAVPAFGPGVLTGTYTVRLIEGGVNDGQFEIIRPDGTTDGFNAVGTAYAGQIRFTLADGATDFSGAAQFTVGVTIAAAANAGQFKLVAPAATDGSETAAAIAVYGVTTDATTPQKIAAIVRGPAEVRISDLVFTAGMNAGQKTAALAQLALIGIIGR